MTPTQFKRVMNAQIKECKAILDEREEYYGTDEDRLDNFRRVAISTRDTAKHALMVMVGKQWDAINSAVVREARGEVVGFDEWTEWITDVINYMLLLKALVIDDLEPIEEE